MDWWWAYLAIGVTVGFLAGLLGIGGGMVMVPMLVFVFTAKGFSLVDCRTFPHVSMEG